MPLLTNNRDADARNLDSESEYADDKCKSNLTVAVERNLNVNVNQSLGRRCGARARPVDNSFCFELEGFAS